MSQKTAANGCSEKEITSIEKQSAFEFTEAEYYEMVEKIVSGDAEGYDILLRKAEKNLKKFVEWKCSSAGWWDFWEDAMQDFYIKLVRFIVTGYICRGESGEINSDYRGLSAWMKTVAENAVKDTLAKQNAYYSKVSQKPEPTDDQEEEDPSNLVPDSGKGPEGTVVDHIINCEELGKCVDTVLSSKNSVYKVLAWLGHRVIAYASGVEDSEANRLLIEQFDKKTLFEIYDMIIAASCGIEWLRFTPKQKEKIEKSLSDVVDGKAMGDRQFNEFYMAKGPESTISDWRNRLDKSLENPFSGSADN